MGLVYICKIPLSWRSLCKIFQAEKNVLWDLVMFANLDHFCRKVSAGSPRSQLPFKKKNFFNPLVKCKQQTKLSLTASAVISRFLGINLRLLKAFSHIMLKCQKCLMGEDI